MPGFDTLNYVKTLETAGVPGPQAQAHAKAFCDAMTAVKTNLVTVNDLKHTEQRLMSEILSTERKLDSKIQKLQEGLSKLTNDMLWMKTIGLGLFATSVFCAKYCYDMNDSLIDTIISLKLQTNS
jgi:hypothetical protein